jgi:hypothetical protein
MWDGSKQEQEIMALHRYFCWSTMMKQLYETALAKGDHLPAEGESADFAALKLMATDTGMLLAYWYSSLYVVCEGWKDLKLSDPNIDAMLGDPNIALLRRFRNGVFHFQSKYVDPRFTEFPAAQESYQWFRALSSAFGGWFLDWFQLKNAS